MQREITELGKRNFVQEKQLNSLAGKYIAAKLIAAKWGPKPSQATADPADEIAPLTPRTKKMVTEDLAEVLSPRTKKTIIEDLTPRTRKTVITEMAEEVGSNKILQLFKDMLNFQQDSDKPQTKKI